MASRRRTLRCRPRSWPRIEPANFLRGRETRAPWLAPEPEPQRVTLTWHEFRRLVAGDTITVRSADGAVVVVELDGQLGLDLLQAAIDDRREVEADDFG